MIDNNVIQQLDSPDPQERKKAIAALARSKNLEALKYLATVVKTDSDPEVADLARKAGIYIRKNAAAQPAPSRPAPGPELVQDRLRDELTPAPIGVEDREPLPEEIKVSRADEERARGHVEQAISWHMRGDNDKAADYLRRAFSANPKLQHDATRKDWPPRSPAFPSMRPSRAGYPRRASFRGESESGRPQAPPELRSG
jgi:tetratricopeptide (TPR) repeat protein